MPIDFPDSPVLNQTYTFGNYTWKWNGLGWENVSSTFGPTGPQGPAGESAAFDFSDTAPTSPTPGDRWVNTQNGVEYTYTYDGTSYQWIQLNPALQGLQGATGPTGSVLIAGQYDGGTPRSVYGGINPVDAGGIVI
ncbi:MAG: hypothetical protein EBS86_09375 [Crocinitomicaceae bacterium]|jgi:hypothetical protein|nr:hypothetical protein [Crocinitomicaceae bacterium]